MSKFNPNSYKSRILAFKDVFQEKDTILVPEDISQRIKVVNEYEAKKSEVNERSPIEALIRGYYTIEKPLVRPNEYARDKGLLSNSQKFVEVDLDEFINFVSYGMNGKCYQHRKNKWKKCCGVEELDALFTYICENNE